MSEFFQSELVKGDLQEMMQLQEYCMRSMISFPVLSPEKKKEYFETLETLVEKQKIFYARLKLSDDPEACAMVETMRDAAVLLGASPSQRVEDVFSDLLKKISVMKERLEAEGA